MSFSSFRLHGLARPAARVVHPFEVIGELAYRELSSHLEVPAPRGLLAGVFSTFILVGPLPAQTFTPSSAPAQNWVSLACSADGSHVAAAGSYGYLFLSGDSGASWAPVNTSAAASEPQRSWQTVAASADGSRLVAVASFCPVFASTNYGRTWSTNGPALNWAAAATTADGTKLVAVDYGVGGIHVSGDSGQTWAQTTAPARRWRCVASSADGTRLVAGTDYGTNYGQLPGLYISGDSGATWQLTTAPNRPWETIASSADGQKLAAGVYGGSLYISANAGTNWTAAPLPSARWSSVSMSTDGGRLIAASWDGQIYLSSDSGQTWTGAAAPNAPWTAVAYTSDGSRAFAGIYNIWDGGADGIYSAYTLSPVSGTAGPLSVSTNGPVLNISMTANAAILSWPTSAVGFQVQENSAAESPGWTDVSATPVAVDARNQITLPRLPGNHFFRLVRH